MEAEFSMVRSDMKLVMPICLRMTGDPYDVWETPFETRNGSGQSKSQNNKDAASSNTSDRAANSSNTSGKGANSSNTSDKGANSSNTSGKGANSSNTSDKGANSSNTSDKGADSSNTSVTKDTDHAGESIIKEADKTVVVSNRELKKQKIIDANAGYERKLKFNLLKSIQDNVKDYKIQCMVTGTIERLYDDGSNNIVRCAHILPHRLHNDIPKLKKIRHVIDDLECARNGLFLLEGFEIAFDQRWIGFPKDECIFNNRMVLKVYNPEECSKLPTFNKSNKFVSEYDGHELKLNINGYEHKPFKTALCHHAITAFSKLPNENNEMQRPPNDLSPEREIPNTRFSQYLNSAVRLLESVDLTQVEESVEEEETEHINVEDTSEQIQ